MCLADARAHARRAINIRFTIYLRRLSSVATSHFPVDAENGLDNEKPAAPHAMPWLEPGQWVRHPAEPGWGTGQIQSVIGHRVTVNFPHAGKVLVNVAVVRLEPAEPD
jgi:hypothetical protein